MPRTKRTASVSTPEARAQRLLTELETMSARIHAMGRELGEIAKELPVGATNDAIKELGDAMQGEVPLENMIDSFHALFTGSVDGETEGQWYG